ncbi:MAG: LysR family transcriptional regulator [Advenella sp.]|uniref:LysR family transcriptional regulator n=1 Tax=Advenella kashmirensis TaxID=310575 RepID=A0A356LFL6_9BURK|nr:LysR family transcriptional regulator [Advenella sp. FME57]HBP29619.1 LysR family transcriptional regulator [Advenella kashmirensis]
MNNDRLNGITTFVRAVEAGSFSLAAERMNLTRSAVGKTIARLEQRLGVLLFQRTSRKQKLTTEGQVYYERCLRALAELDAADAELNSGRLQPQGVLRVSAPKLIGRHCITPTLTPLIERYPELRIEIIYSDRVADLIEDGLDLAVRIGPLADSGSLVARPLGRQHQVLCASPAYLARHGVPDSVAALNGHHAIAYHRAGQDLVWQTLFANTQGPTVDIRLRLDDLHSLTDAAIAGVGLAWLPDWQLLQFIRTRQLNAVLPKLQLLPTEIYIVWPQTRFLPAKTRVAIDTLLADAPAILRNQISPR